LPGKQSTVFQLKVAPSDRGKIIGEHVDPHHS
jgi:predicted RNA-binding protein YlqC (UPF0109 family)